MYRQVREDLVLDSMHEGQFKQGAKNGYVRGMSAVDGSCSAGIHVENQIKGKFCSYKASGEMSKQEGFYVGS